MGFDLSSAKEIKTPSTGGFDLSSAKPISTEDFSKHPNWNKYQEYLATEKEKTGLRIPAKPGTIPTGNQYSPDTEHFPEYRPMSFPEWNKDFEWNKGNLPGKILAGTIDTALALGAGALDASTPGLLYGIHKYGSAEQSMQNPIYTPKTPAGEAALHWLGSWMPPVMAHIPSEGTAVRAHNARLRKLTETPPEAILEQAVPKPPPKVPEQQELPLATPVEAIAERRGIGSGQPDFFFSDQANLAALGEGSLADAQRRYTPLADWEARRAGTQPLLQHQDVLDFTPHGDVPAQFGSTLEHGRLDEHGIPIRADLSMEAQQLQNPLQRNLWGDELPGRTGDGGRPLTQALDSMPPGPERSTAIGRLSGIGPGHAGPGGGITRGALDASVFREGFKGINRWLSRLTDQPWLARKFPSDKFETNQDGTPLVVLHGTRTVFEGMPKGVTEQGLHASFAVPAHRMAAKGVIPNRGGPWRVGNLRFDSQHLPSERSSLYPLTIKKGNYPVLTSDFGDWSPRLLANSGSYGSGMFRSELYPHVKHLGYTLDTIKDTLNNWFKANEWKHGEEFNLSWANFLADKFGIDGFWYPNGVETAHVPARDSLTTASRASKVNKTRETKSFVTWDDQNVESVYSPRQPEPQGWSAPPRTNAFGGTDLSHGSGRTGGLQGGRIDFGTERIRDAFKKITDITKAVQTFQLPDIPTVIKEALSGKDGSGWDLFETGATMTAAKRNSPLISAVGRITQWHKSVAERNIRDFVFPYEKAVRRLGKQEVSFLGEALRREMFNGVEMSIPSLREHGVSEKVLLAYQALRDMHNQAYELQNARRIADGKPPLTKMEAYLNSQWQGTHRRAIKTSDGRTVWFLASDSLPRLEHDTKKVLSQFPDLVPDTPFIARQSKTGIGLEQIYASMVDIMGESPEFAKIKQWYEAQLAETTQEALGQERFFERKYKVHGFIGDRPLTLGRTQFTEARDMLNTQAQYAKSSFMWSALQDAREYLKPLFSDETLQSNQPNNLLYAKRYFMHQLGGDEWRWVKQMEDFINESMPKGITTTGQLGRGLQDVKAVWIAQKLAVNAGYATANVLQLSQTLPYMVDINVKHGGNPITALAIGSLGGTLLVAQHQLPVGKVNLAHMYAGLPEGLRDFMATAMKYAEDNQVVLSSAADEAPIGKSFGVLAKAKRAADWTISFPDSLRGIAFMTYAGQLWSSGKFDTPTVLAMAHEYTTRSMVDFRSGEKPMIFNKMGTAGIPMNTLQSFTANYLQQWNWALRESARKNPLPALTMLVTQGAIGGALGLPLFKTIDDGLEWLKDYLRDNHPLTWKKIREFSLSDMLLKAGGDLGEHLLYGAASKTPTGISVASRVQAPTLAESAATPLAPVRDFAQQAISVGKAVLDPNPQSIAQAAYNITPSGLQGAMETGLLREQMSVPAGDTGGRIIPKVKDLESRTGMFTRTPEEERIRTTGIRAQSEVFKRDRAYKEEKKAHDAQLVTKVLPDKIWNAARLGKQDDLVDYIRLYAELNPTMSSTTLASILANQGLTEYTTTDQRLIINKPTPERLLAYKRIQEALKKAGYAN